MKLLTVFVSACLFVGITYCDDDSTEELPLAEPCVDTECTLPDCRCSTTHIPGGLEARNTPQFVMMTFDDGINILNIETYRRTIYNRSNSNNCPAGATFYVSHEYTNYQLVNELHQQGFEIALHSITHQTPQTYWAEANFNQMMKEFGDQRTQISHFANIPIEDVKGMRIPFLQMTGNSSFQMMAEAGLLYDSTWGTINEIDPGLWPYSLEFASTQECMIPPCPTASIPKVWEVPMLSWLDVGGSPCAMVDSCFQAPPIDDEDAWFRFIVGNFERQYLGNRAPFGFFVHEWYVSTYPVVERALIRFLNMINNMEDVFMVTAEEVVNWVRNPTPINEYRKQPCRRVTPSSCNPHTCGPLATDHNEMEYYLSICISTCPNVYPWLGNPLGE